MQAPTPRWILWFPLSWPRRLVLFLLLLLLLLLLLGGSLADGKWTVLFPVRSLYFSYSITALHNITYMDNFWWNCAVCSLILTPNHLMETHLILFFLFFCNIPKVCFKFASQSDGNTSVFSAPHAMYSISETKKHQCNLELWFLPNLQSLQSVCMNYKCKHHSVIWSLKSKLSSPYVRAERMHGSNNANFFFMQWGDYICYVTRYSCGCLVIYNKQGDNIICTLKANWRTVKQQNRNQWLII